MSRERSHSTAAFRAAVVVAASAPAMCIGGAPAWVTTGFAALVGIGLLLAPTARRKRAPVAAFALLALAVICLLQTLPGSLGLAPALRERVTAIDPSWNSLSVLPGETLLRAARFVALAGLILAARRVGWRLIARSLAVLGVVIALVGYAQYATGAQELLWFYEPIEASITGTRRGIPTTFVNPNHQVTLLLMSMAASVALLVDERRESRNRRAAPAQLLIIAIALQAGIVLLSESRGGWAASVVLVILFGSDWVAKSTQKRRAVLIGTAVLATAALVVAWVVQLEALQEKLVSIELGVALYRESPLLGFGHGCFGELSALVRSDHTNVRYVYVESGIAGVVFETGVVGIACLGTLAFVVVRGHARAPSRSQRLMWLGLAAVGIHSLMEFSLEMLGVSAAAAATLGSLDQKGVKLPAIALRIVAALCLGATALAYYAGPRSRLALDHGADPGADSSWRPLSFRRALAAARQACTEREESCIPRAAAAAKVAPFSVENWLMLSLARQRAGDMDGSHEALREGLAWLSAPVGKEFAVYIARWWTAPQLAAAFPDSADVYRFVQAPLLEVAPAHLAAVSEARTALNPDDPRPVANSARAAMALGQGAQAIEHGEQLVRLEPDRVENWLLLAEIERTDAGGEVAVRRQLNRALEHLSRPDEVERIRTALVLSLLADPVEAAQARDLAQELVRAANTVEKRERFASLRDRASVALRDADDR